MDMQTTTAFFMWCTILNGALLGLTSCMCLCAPNFIYQVQSKWFPIKRETFDVVIYSFIGLFKLFFIVFSATPYVALLIIG